MYPNHVRSKDQTCSTLQLSETSLSTPCFSPAFCLDRETLGHSEQESGAWAALSKQIFKLSQVYGLK